jgi:hypothetical protein
MSWDTVSPGYRPLSWGYPGILRMPPVSHDANLRFQMLHVGLTTVCNYASTPLVTWLSPSLSPWL